MKLFAKSFRKITRSTIITRKNSRWKRFTRHLNLVKLLPTWPCVSNLFWLVNTIVKFANDSHDFLRKAQS